MERYKNIEKILKSWGQKTVKGLERVVGVDTGALKSSLDYKIEDEGLIIKMLDYGQYINPWIKETGSKSEPGYLTIFRRNEKTLLTALKGAFIEDMILQTIKGLKQYKSRLKKKRIKMIVRRLT